MNIYNFYSDLLLSLRYFFDNFVLGQDVIKSYQFNIGSRTFQLKYESQHDLPACIINYVDSHPVKYSNWVNQKMFINNYYKIPILYDTSKNLTLDLQTELYEINIEANINCDSQLPALNIRHLLEKEMPIGKLYSIYNFYTFLDIPDYYFSSDKFDNNNDNIVNLYVKHNFLTDKVEYCASLLCEPLIRLDSISVPLSNTEPRSFQVNMQFTIVMAIPMSLQIPFDDYPRNIESRDIIEYGSIVPTNNSIFLGKEGDNIFPVFSDDKSIISKGSGKFLVHDEEYSCDIAITTINGKMISVSLEGSLSTDIINPKIFNNSLTGFIYTKYNNIEKQYLITGDYSIYSETLVDNELIAIPYSIYLNTFDINSKIVKFKPENSIITHILIIEKDNTFHNIAVNSKMNMYGDIRCSFQYKSNLQNRTIFSTLIGKIHPEKRRIDIRLVDEQTETFHSLLGFIGDFCFNNVPIYGNRGINKIDFSINVTESESQNIVCDDQQFIIDNINNGFSVNSTFKTLCSLIITDINCFIVDNDIIKIKVDLSNIIDISSLNGLYWCFNYKNDIFDNNGKLIIFDSIVDNCLYFICDSTLYNTYLKYFDITHPIFFQIRQPIIR